MRKRAILYNVEWSDYHTAPSLYGEAKLSYWAFSVARAYTCTKEANHLCHGERPFYLLSP